MVNTRDAWYGAELFTQLCTVTSETIFAGVRNGGEVGSSLYTIFIAFLTESRATVDVALLRSNVSHRRGPSTEDLLAITECDV